MTRTFFVPSGASNAWAVFEWDGTTINTLNQLYTISGVPQPALQASRTALTAEQELRDLIQQLPAKPRMH